MKHRMGGKWMGHEEKIKKNARKQGKRERECTQKISTENKYRKQIQKTNTENKYRK